jgi:hypothetical protein
MSTNGALATLVSFDGNHGAYPSAGLATGAYGNLFGTTSGEGNGVGTIFRILSVPVPIITKTVKQAGGTVQIIGNGGSRSVFPAAYQHRGNTAH